MTFDEWKAECRLTNEHPATLLLLETCWEAATFQAERNIALLQEALKESLAERARLVNKLAGGVE